MKRLGLAILAIASICAYSPARADFGDADFPADIFKDGPKSYHDAWCRRIKNKCRVRFQGPAMWVEGQGGIQRSDLIGYRFDEDGDEYYNYLTYKSRSGETKYALFLFANHSAQTDFIRAIGRWMKQGHSPKAAA